MVHNEFDLKHTTMALFFVISERRWERTQKNPLFLLQKIFFFLWVLRAALSGALALRRLGFLAFWFFVFSVRLASWLGGVLAFWFFGFSVLVASCCCCFCCLLLLLVVAVAAALAVVDVGGLSTGGEGYVTSRCSYLVEGLCIELRHGSRFDSFNCCC